tara:strand:+ start:3009 stop:3221 length:213 start_codon:yes stop_codon:yes gene_type:complete
MDNNQIENIEKYKVGIPKMAPSKLKTKINGILKIKHNAIDNTTSFCSCLFFIRLIGFAFRESEKFMMLLI